MKVSTKKLKLLASSLGLQSLILILFRSQLRSTLPIYFSATGTITNSLTFTNSILGPAIVYLLLLTLVNVGAQIWVNQVKNSNIANTQLLAVIGQIFSAWLLAFTWVLLLYFFNITNLGSFLMMILNVAAFIAMTLLVVRTFYRRK